MVDGEVERARRDTASRVTSWSINWPRKIRPEAIFESSKRLPGTVDSSMVLASASSCLGVGSLFFVA